MSIVCAWKGGDDVVSITSGSYIGFYGTAFNQSIPLNNYNGVTIVTNKLGTVNNGSLPNAKYTSPGYGIFTNVTHGTISGSIDSIFAPTGKDMTLHIRITSGSAARLSSVNLIAFSGNNINTSPTDATVVGFESGSAKWTVMDGLAKPLALTPHTVAATVHDYYASVSVAPKVKGATTNIVFALQADWL